MDVLERNHVVVSGTPGAQPMVFSDGYGCDQQMWRYVAPAFQGFALTINAANSAEALRLFTGIAEGGKIQMPLEKTFFAASFGIAVDKFGVNWMVISDKE